MSGIPAGQYHSPGQYEIRLKGHLEARWAAWFDGLTVTPDSDGTTIIHGLVADQAALHGLLQKTRDLGLPLISVNYVEPGQPPGAGHPPQLTQPFTKGAQHGDRRTHPGHESDEGNPDDLNEENSARRGRLLPDHL